MIKLKNMAHFFVLANFEQKEIVAAGELLLQRGNKKYYKIQDYYLTEETMDIAGKPTPLRTIGDHLPKEILEGIKLSEIFMNDPEMHPKHTRVDCQAVLSLLALLSCKESPIEKDIWLSPYFQINMNKPRNIDLTKLSLN